MIRDKYFIAEDYRKASVGLLVENLAALRARIGITQEEMANAIGVSRQTYYSIETGRRKMSWPLYLAIIFFFDCMSDTSEMIRDLKIYPIDLVMQFNGELQNKMLK